MKHYLITTGALLVLLGLVTALNPAWQHPDQWLLFVMAAGPAFIVARINSGAAKAGTDNQLTFQLGTLMFRMLASLTGLGLLLYYRKYNEAEQLWAVALFFLVYIIYASVEVKSFLTNLRRH